MTVAQLWRVLAYLNGGKIGFDAARRFSGDVKANTIAYMLQHHTADAITAALDHAGPANPMRRGRRASQNAEPSAPQAAAAAATNPDPNGYRAKPEPIPAAASAKAEPSNAAAQLAALLQQLAQSNNAPLDRDAVQQMIDASLSGFTAPNQPVSLEISVNDAPAVTIDCAHPMLPTLVKCAAAGVPAWLAGPAGSGKTTLAAQVARALGREFFATNRVTGAHELAGFVNATGYVRTALRDAVEHGGVFLLDEIDASDESALIWVNLLTAAKAGDRIPFPDAPAGIERHADFVFLAAGNTYGTGASREYVGRTQIDAATLDRFAFFEIAYDETLERAISGADDWTAHVQAVRAAIVRLASSGERIRHIVSPRASIHGARMLAAGIDRNTVEQAVIFKGLAADVVARIRGAL